MDKCHGTQLREKKIKEGWQFSRLVSIVKSRVENDRLCAGDELKRRRPP
jgi:hypothetical protein